MKYRCTATVTWNFESSLSQKEVAELAKNHLRNIPSQDGIEDFRHVIRLDPIKERIEKIRLGEFSIEDVLPYLSDTKKEYECGGEKHQVRMNSSKYFLLRENTSCVVCGLNATKVFLECYQSDMSPHFNFYGEENGELVLLTKDHIHPKSFGGEDRHSNYQTMCLICNNLKGSSNITIENLKKLRQIFNENKTKTKKKLNVIIETARKSLEMPWNTTQISSFQRKKKLVSQKATADAVVTKCDINFYQNSDMEIIGKSVYEPCTFKHLGCIRRGSYLEPLVAVKEQLMCKMIDDVIIVHHSLVKTRD